MKSDAEKSKEELISELQDLREKLCEVESLPGELKSCQTHLTKLKKRYDDQNNEFSTACIEHQRVEKALRMSELIVEQSPVVLFRRNADETFGLEYISENLHQFGYSPEEFISGTRQFKEIVHPEDRERLKAEIADHALTDVEEYEQIYRILTKAGEVRWVADRTSVVRNDIGEKTHNQGILIDITKHKLAEDELRKSEEKFRRIVETAAEGFFLMDQEFKIMEANTAYCRMLGYKKEEIVGARPWDFATEEFRQFILLNKDDIFAREYREFDGMVVAKDGRHVPIISHGNTLRDDSGNIIGHMAFVTDMTEQKKALRLAGEVQKSLLPQNIPVVQGLDIAGRNVSCDEIGGDYYDFIWRRESDQGPFSVVVGDISGHGVDSALLMTTARAFLRMRASQSGTISEVVGAMNHHLTQDVHQTGRFMTLFYLTVYPHQKKIDWVRAGHDPAILYDPVNDTFEELKGSGIALGVMDEFNFVENQKSGLTNGQVIAIGTDGIWEAMNRDKVMFGKSRFRDVIRRTAQGTARDIVNSVYEELTRFTAGQKSVDDITLVIIKVDGLEE